MYCSECWEIGRKYRDQMVSIQNEAWQKENDLRVEWHREGREKKRQSLVASKHKQKVCSNLGLSYD
jgi:hypothetical protein